MKRYRNLGIHTKMQVMTLIICGTILVVAIVALFTFQVLNFRSNFQREAATLAVITANNSTAAMQFSDTAAASEVVSALKAEPTVISASLVLPDRSVIAHYGKSEDPKSLSQYPNYRSAEFVNGQLLVMQPINMKGEWVGTLYLRSDYERTFKELISLYGQVIFCVIVVSSGLGVLLSRRLSRTITAPVLELARTAQIVGEKKDYSVRVVIENRDDELGRLTQSFNDMLNRIQSQDAALGLSQQKMEGLIHSIDGIVWERTPDFLRFTFISRQSEEITGYTPAQWLEEPGFWESKIHPQDADKASHTGREMADCGQSYGQEFRMFATDGRIVWIRESGTVVTENGRAVAIRGIFQDITQSKIDAEQLDKLNRQLLDTNRRAGMAEVATGVLHNVGNVLNSVSVSATLVGDKLRNSKTNDLYQAANMLDEQNGHLAEFLTSDPRGKLIPKFIATMAKHLAGEQTWLQSEVSSIGHNIEHIKEIVAMQQNYAKVSGVHEYLPVIELIEDALRMNDAGFERHYVQVIREFEENIPNAFVDRHKVLQILINLLRNAKHALDDQPNNDKRIVIRVGLAGPGFIRITVSDNGVGIAPENLNKIFNHGFTTKKGGHGFGLHSGANAAKEMNGSLAGHSDGIGKGAIFTLELPVAAPHPVAAIISTK